MVYTYDSLLRLTQAHTTGSQWGQAYTFYGFGNLTSKTVTKGAGTNWAEAYDPATNRAVGTGLTYDANGNPTTGGYNTYDVENRLTANNLDGGTQYSYDPSGKRVLKQSASKWSLWFYGITGQRMVEIDALRTRIHSHGAMNRRTRFTSRASWCGPMA